MEEAGMFALSAFACILSYIHAVNPFKRNIRLSLYLLFLQYVVVSSKKILFYNDEQDKEQSNPSMVLDIE